MDTLVFYFGHLIFQKACWLTNKPLYKKLPLYDILFFFQAGIFMQFFTVSAFSWMFVEVVQMYLMFVKRWRIERLKMKYFSSFGWGLSTFILVITISVHFGILNFTSVYGVYPEYYETQM